MTISGKDNQRLGYEMELATRQEDKIKLQETINKSNNSHIIFCLLSLGPTPSIIAAKLRHRVTRKRDKVAIGK